MEDLTIRRNRSFAVPQRQAVNKSDRSSGTAASQTVSRGTGLNVSETLRQLMARGAQGTEQSRESRRTLQAGEGVLAEVQEKLGRMAELAEEAAKADGGSREALQAELEHLKEEVNRMLSGASADGVSLFSDETAEEAGAAEGAEENAPAQEETALKLPNWLTNALAGQGTLDADRLLVALGLDKTASGAQLLAALANRPLESDPVSGYIAALYLGAVISGGAGISKLDPSEALDGLRQLFQMVADGVPIDEALKELTGGEYTSLADFQAQFSAGTAPDLQAFLADLLLTESAGDLLSEMSLLDFLGGLSGLGGTDLMSLLMTLGQTSGSAPAPDESADTFTAETAWNAAALPEAAAPPMEVMQFGDLQVMGRDLSAVVYDDASGQLTIGGTADVAVMGQAGQGGQGILLTGSGTVTVQDLRSSVLIVESAEARIETVGMNALEEVRLNPGTTLTMDGQGLLRVGTFRGGEDSSLHLTGGALALRQDADGTPGILTVPVVLEGPVSLAAQASSVRSADGQTMEPLDILWQTLLPGFGSVAAMELNGRQARMLLMGGEHPDALRLWLEKGDLSSHGYPAQLLTIRGRDESGHARTRYAYLQWDQRAGRFQKVIMYPNPFQVTGGEQDKDWAYEEETRTLQILSGQVTAISGGAGMDARQEPFSGRIVIQDSIGPLQLALGGVVCRVSAGRAFHLGKENDVTLILRNGTENLFESGEGCAGISMGDGTSLRVDCVPSRNGETAGTLIATGGKGCAGIGRDRGADRAGHIMIRGGIVTSGDQSAETVTIVGNTAGGGSDLGSAKTWARMGIFLQMGEDAVILPQYAVSSRTLRLNKLRVSTRVYAQAARMTIDADRRWVSQIQTAYHKLSGELDSILLDAGQAGGLLRDSTSANILLHEVSRSAPILSDRAMQVRSLQSLEEVNRLLR